MISFMDELLMHHKVKRSARRMRMIEIATYRCWMRAFFGDIGAWQPLQGLDGPSV